MNNTNARVKLNKKEQIFILNQIFEIESKVNKLNESNSINRNIRKLKNFYENDFHENISFVIENPIDQKYDETRIDLEANIIGDKVNNLFIIDVIKPIIRIKEGNANYIIQKGIVIVQSKNKY